MATGFHTPRRSFVSGPAPTTYTNWQSQPVISPTEAQQDARKSADIAALKVRYQQLKAAGAMEVELPHVGDHMSPADIAAANGAMDKVQHASPNIPRPSTPTAAASNTNAPTVAAAAAPTAAAVAANIAGVPTPIPSFHDHMDAATNGAWKGMSIQQQAEYLRKNPAPSVATQPDAMAGSRTPKDAAIIANPSDWRGKVGTGNPPPMDPSWQANGTGREGVVIPDTAFNHRGEKTYVDPASGGARVTEYDPRRDALGGQAIADKYGNGGPNGVRYVPPPPVDRGQPNPVGGVSPASAHNDINGSPLAPLVAPASVNPVSPEGDTQGPPISLAPGSVQLQQANARNAAKASAVQAANATDATETKDASDVAKAAQINAKPSPYTDKEVRDINEANPNAYMDGMTFNYADGGAVPDDNPLSPLTVPNMAAGGPFPYDPLDPVAQQNPMKTAQQINDANFVQRNLDVAANTQAGNLRAARAGLAGSGVPTAETHVNSGVVQGAGVAPVTATVAASGAGNDSGVAPGQYHDAGATQAGPQLGPLSLFSKASPVPGFRGAGTSNFRPGVDPNDDSGTSNYAKGGIPAAINREKTAIAAGVGGAKPGDKPQVASIAGKPAVINSGEKVVNMARGTAVLTRDMQKKRPVAPPIDDDGSNPLAMFARNPADSEFQKRLTDSSLNDGR